MVHTKPSRCGSQRRRTRRSFRRACSAVRRSASDHRRQLSHAPANLRYSHPRSRSLGQLNLPWGLSFTYLLRHDVLFCSFETRLNLVCQELVPAPPMAIEPHHAHGVPGLDGDATMDPSERWLAASTTVSLYPQIVPCAARVLFTSVEGTDAPSQL